MTSNTLSLSILFCYTVNFALTFLFLFNTIILFSEPSFIFIFNPRLVLTGPPIPALFFDIFFLSYFFTFISSSVISIISASPSTSSKKLSSDGPLFICKLSNGFACLSEELNSHFALLDGWVLIALWVGLEIDTEFIFEWEYLGCTMGFDFLFGDSSTSVLTDVLIFLKWSGSSRSISMSYIFSDSLS